MQFRAAVGTGPFRAFEGWAGKAVCAVALSLALASAAQAQFGFGLGAGQADAGEDVAVDSNGNTTLIGSFRQTVDFDPGAGTANLTAVGNENFVASYGPTGNFRYAFALGGSNAVVPERGIAVDGFDNIYVTGWFSGIVDFDPGAGTATLDSSSGNLFVASYTSAGAFRYAFNLDSGVNGEQGSDIAVDPAGNSYVTGFFSGTIDFDPGAGSSPATSAGVNDIFVASYDTLGGLRFGIGVGGTLADEGLGIAVDTAGNSYVTGSFTGSADFEPGAGVTTLNAVGARDAFLASYTDAGALRYALSLGDSTTDIGNGVAVDASGNALVTGQFEGSVDFDPGAGTTTVTSAGGGDAFVASYTTAGALRFAFPLGDIAVDRGFDAAVDGAGNFYVTGEFNNAVDFNPAGGMAILNPSGAAQAYVASYTNTGAYRVAYSTSGVSTATARGIGLALDASGRSHVIGTFQGTIDVDVTAGTENISSVADDIFFTNFVLLPLVPSLGPWAAALLVVLLGASGALRLRR